MSKNWAHHQCALRDTATRCVLAAVLAAVLVGAVSGSASAQFPASPAELPKRPQSAIPPLGQGAPPRSYSDETAAPFIGELGKRSGDRPPRMSAAERAATRERYGDLGPTEAADLARRIFADELATPVFDLANPPGASLVRTSGRFAAVLKDDNTGQTSLMLSSSPVRQTIKQDADPVNLTLERAGATFRPAVPLIDTRFTEDPQQALSFPGRGVSLGLATSSKREPIVRDDRATHFEAGTDTDLILTPRPEGAELYLQLRGPAAPTDFLLDVDMPAEAVLREFKPENPIPGDTEGPWPIEVVEDGRQLAVIYPPAAHDAEGRPVISRLRIDENNLRLSVEHRGQQLAYPMLADPEVYVPQYEGQPSSWAGWRHQIFRSQTSIQQGHYPYFGAQLANYNYGPGMYLSMPTNNGYYAGDFTEFIWQAPLDVFVTRARLNWMGHAPYYSGVFHGIANASNTVWEGGVGFLNQANAAGGNPFGTATHAFNGATHDFCYGSPFCNAGGSDQNNVIVGLQALPPGCCMGTGANKATMQANSMELYLGDRYAPTLIGGVPGSRDWFDDTEARTRTVTPQVTDRGLGVKQIELAGTTDTSETLRGFPCTGHPYESPCTKDTRSAPRSLAYSLAEGVNTLTVSAADATLKQTSGGTWTEKLDRSPPALTGITGALVDARERPEGEDQRFAGLDEGSYGLNVVATDAKSGVRSIEVFVDGASQRSKGGYVETLPTNGTHPASVSLNWNLQADDYADGRHSVKLVARDKLADPTSVDAGRHVRVVETLTVVVDRRGDIAHGVALPADGENSVQDDEYVQAATNNARRDDGEAILTFAPVTCDQDPRGCLELRTATREPTGGAANAHSVTTGSSFDDSRLLRQSQLLAARIDSAGDPAASGAQRDVLRTFQRPPPGHGSTYLRFDAISSAVVEERLTQLTTRLYVDAATRLPLRSESLEDDIVVESDYWTYDAERLSRADLSADFFSVGAPAGAMQRSEVLSSEPEQPVSASEPPSDEEMVDDSRAFRSLFGLDDDLATVRQAIADPTALLSIDTFGVPLLAPELTEMQLRIDAEQDASSIDDFGAARPESYAGRYWDARTGLLHVGFTAGASNETSALEELFAYPSRLRTFTAERTLAALQQKITDIRADTASGTLALQVTSISVNEETNKVEVGTPSPTDDDKEILQSRYGSGIALVASEPKLAATAIDAPLRPFAAGLDFYKELRRSRKNCTAGFTVVSKGTAPGGRIFRRNYKLTAGHCQFNATTDGLGAGAGTTFYHAGDALGETRRTAYPQKGKASDADAAAVALRVPRVTSSLLFVRDDGKNSHLVKVTGGVIPSPGQGSPMCHSGAREKKPWCGKVVNRSKTINGTDGTDLTEQVAVEFGRCAVREGDSGGPAFRRVGKGRVDAIGLTTAFATEQPSGCDLSSDPNNIGFQGGSLGYFTTLPNALKQLSKARPTEPLSLLPSDTR